MRVETKPTSLTIEAIIKAQLANLGDEANLLEQPFLSESELPESIVTVLRAEELWTEVEGIRFIPAAMARALIERNDGDPVLLKPLIYQAINKSRQKPLLGVKLLGAERKPAGYWDENFFKVFFKVLDSRTDRGRNNSRNRVIEACPPLDLLRKIKQEAEAEMLKQGMKVTPSQEESEPNEAELSSIKPEILSDKDIFADIDADDTIGLYLKEVSRVPLLTAEEEVILAKRREQGRLASEELGRGGTSQERREELRLIIENGSAAEDHLIRANARLVISVAKKYLGKGVPFLDLIQEGNIGLIRATMKFDYHRGNKFSTYATWWIRQAVDRAVADHGRTIRLPVHFGDQVKRLFRVRQALMQTLGREPTDNELANELGETTSETVRMMMDIARKPLSLEAPVNEDEGGVIGDFVKSDAPDPDDEAAAALLRQHLGEVLQGLSPREVTILQLRYGLLDGQARTLDETGRKLGVTRERIRQIEAKALGRLRHPANRRKLRDYLK